MKPVISIIDYGLGNIFSIQNAIKTIGYESRIVRTSEEVLSSTHLILPGVGSFPHAMKNLKDKELDLAIIEYADSGRSILGICLGMQLMFNSSAEHGYTKGLSLLNGKIEKFEKTATYCIPQIQWNKVCNTSCGVLMHGLKGEDFFYFLHSYYAKVNIQKDGYIIYKSKYNGIEYVSAIEYNNIFAVQFHPEKSGNSGLKLIKNFIEGRNDEKKWK